jgi:hypothetical protein
MIKLHRRDASGTVHYWEAWQSEPRTVTLHKGEVGEIGLTTSVRVPLFRSAEKVIAAESREPLAEGYAEIAPDNHTQLILQFAMGEDPEADLRRVQEVDDLCNEVLGWTGNGHCDGHDIGSGTLNVFNEVVLAEVATTTLREALAKGGHDEFVIAVGSNNELRVVWPEDHSGEFSF